MSGTLWFILKMVPLLVVTAAVFTYFGWVLRRRFHAPAAASHAKPAVADDLPARERVKKLENSLKKAEAARKAADDELAAVQAKSISKVVHDKLAQQLTDANLKVEGEAKRMQALEAELKRARDTVSNLSSKANEANKGQQERVFALENELSKVRGELAALIAKPDRSAELEKEVARLRDALTNANRVVGELRKSEAAAVADSEKARKKLDAARAKAAEAAEAAEKARAAIPVVSVAGAFARMPSPPPISRTAEAKAGLERIEAARKATEDAAARTPISEPSQALPEPEEAPVPVIEPTPEPAAEQLAEPAIEMAPEPVIEATTEPAVDTPATIADAEETPELAAPTTPEAEPSPASEPQPSLIGSSQAG